MKKAYNTNYFFHKQERIKRSGILNNKRYLHLHLILFIYIKLIMDFSQKTLLSFLICP